MTPDLPRVLPSPRPPRPPLRTALVQGLAGLLWLALAWLLLVQPARAGTLPGELPALVGRLSALAGDVRWYDRDSGQWVASSDQQPLRNWPLAAGDRLRTGPGGRAELRVGSTTVRLGADAELWLSRLDEQGVLLHLQSGSLAVRLAAIDQDGFGPVEMLTREGRWLPQRPGHYRLDRERDATQASTWRGELRFEAYDSTLTIPAGRRADLWQDPPGTTRYAWAGIDRDAFADWVARDERQDDAPQTARHVQPGMTGWQDLDRHGDWIEDPDYGSVWQPRVVAPGWAPFHDGRWAWVAPWGWTWIDAAPWGFAPFHYGSWVTVGGRWCWSPGPRHQAPRYAPALSAWISLPLGHNGNINLRIGGGRPPLPRVVVPPPRPPVVVVLPPPVIVQPPRPRGPEPARPPVTGPRPPDRQDREGRDAGRREPERRDSDRREGDRREPERREPDRRDPDRRDFDRRDRDNRAPQPGAVVEPRPQRPETRPDTWPEVRPDTRPDTRPDPRPVVRPYVRPEVQPDRHPEPRQDRGDGRSDRGQPRGATPAVVPAPAAAVPPAPRPVEPARTPPPAAVVPAAPAVVPAAPAVVPAARPPEPPRVTVPRAPRDADERREPPDNRQPREPREERRSDRGQERGNDRGNDRGERPAWR